MEKQFDVFGMCNALFDLQAEVSDELLADLQMSKGGMMLLSHEEQQALVPRVYTHLVHTEAGGSGANTMIGVAQLGGTTCFTSRVAGDEHGKMYARSLREQNVVPHLGTQDDGVETGVSLILVTPDTQRTMCTYLGASQKLQTSDINLDDLRASKYLYVTGYLWDTDTQKEAVLHAMREAHSAGVKVALSLSDPFCVVRHKADFIQLLGDYVDVVFSNKDEATELTGQSETRAALAALVQMTRGKIAVLTQDKNGSLIGEGDNVYEVPAYKVQAVDTTGAGDMYAAGLLYGLTQELPLPVAGRIAAYSAAQVVAKIGPRVTSLDKEAIAVLKSGV